MVFDDALGSDHRHPLVEGPVDLLNKVENQMMERMPRVKDRGAGRSGGAEFGEFGHFLPFCTVQVLSPGLLAFPGYH
jgi:hypothetical protein